MLNIEQNIPLPPRIYGRQSATKTSKYSPLLNIKVGESFLFPMKGKIATKQSNYVGASVRAFAKRWELGHKYAVRIVEGGVRVWRVS